MRNPLATGGCGDTTPSLQKTPNLKGIFSLADPSGFALTIAALSISLFHGMLMTPGSRSHGFVERMDVITSFMALSVVPMTPTEDA